MLIDWFTVGAQVLNFLVLVWLMKHFLYKPILNAIDEREKRIAKKLTDAETRNTEAQNEREAFQRKNEEFDRERQALIDKATGEAKAEGERLLEAAQSAADVLRVKRDERLQSESRAINDALTRRTQQVVFQIVRKALGDLATTSLEERLGEVFTRRLREMGAETRGHLAHALTTKAETAVVRSAFALPAQEQALVQNALNEAFSAEVPLRFEVAPNVISGIELSCGGQKVGWSIEEYLLSLEHGVTEVLEAETKAAAQSPEAEVDPKVGPKPQATAAKPTPATRSA